MNEQFAFLRLVTERLQRIDIAAMLTGSLALGVWARP